MYMIAIPHGLFKSCSALRTPAIQQPVIQINGNHLEIKYRYFSINGKAEQCTPMQVDLTKSLNIFFPQVLCAPHEELWGQPNKWPVPTSYCLMAPPT